MSGDRPLKQQQQSPIKTTTTINMKKTLSEREKKNLISAAESVIEDIYIEEFERMYVESSKEAAFDIEINNRQYQVQVLITSEEYEIMGYEYE